MFYCMERDSRRQQKQKEDAHQNLTDILSDPADHKKDGFKA